MPAHGRIRSRTAQGPQRQALQAAHSRALLAGEVVTHPVTDAPRIHFSHWSHWPRPGTYLKRGTACDTTLCDNTCPGSSDECGRCDLTLALVAGAAGFPHPHLTVAAGGACCGEFALEHFVGRGRRQVGRDADIPRPGLRPQLRLLVHARPDIRPS